MRASRILIVEDNPIALKMLRMVLESAGYQVTAAGDGRTALDAMRKQPPDLVLQDLLLPDMDGFDLARQLRQLPGGNDVPILAVSGMHAKVAEAEGDCSGFDGCLLKPIEPARLLKAVQEFLPEPEPAAEPGGRGQRVLIADDDPLQRKLLSIRLQQKGFSVTQAVDGQEAFQDARDKPPDAIVCDILMPGLDGFELCHAVRSDPKLARIPIILASAAYLEEEDRVLSRQVGADGFVLKTPGCQEIIDAVERALQAQVQSGASEHRPAEWGAEQHAHRVSRQLERQVIHNTALAREVAIQRVQLTILSGMTDVFTWATQVRSALGELIARCLESTGFTLGAVYLTGPDGALSFQAQVGLPPGLEPEAADFFGHLADLRALVERGESVWIPSDRFREPWADELRARLQAESLLIAPLTGNERLLGALVMGSAEADPSDGILEFGKAVRGQLSLALALGQTVAQLAESERRFRNISETAAEGILQTGPGGQIVYMNPAAERMFDYEQGSALGRTLQDLLPTTECAPGRWEGEGLTRDGRAIAVEGSTREGPDSSGLSRLTHVLRDLTERKQFEAQLTHAANHDPLTGLLNRSRLLEELDRQVVGARRYGARGALLLLDVDQFGSINDALGQQAGDILLQATGHVLANWLPEGDILARPGGDQFAVLLLHADEGRARSLAGEALDLVAQNSVWLEDRPIRLTASIGIAPITGACGSGDEVFNRAEVALSAAKAEGRNRYSLFAGTGAGPMELHDKLYRRQRISDALARDRFQLLFQPLVSTKTGATVAYEALLRMEGENGELIPPSEFLDVAERFGLIRAIDRWVVRRSIGAIARARSAGGDLVLHVNLSARAFAERELLPLIREELAATGVPPQNLCFEITETAAISSLVEARRFIMTLREGGCRFALDDFGVGFCSFHYLKHLPVDIIKIDGSFIRDLPNSRVDQHLVHAILAVARGLGKQTVAESVEDQQTLDLVRRLGVDYAQGFFPGRPSAKLAGVSI